VGRTVILCFVNNSLVKREVWGGALSWCNSQFFCRRSPGRSLRTSSCSRRKTSQKHAELTAWPARTNYLWAIPLMSKKIMSMLFTSLFTYLDFFSLGEFVRTVYGSCYLCQGLRHIFSEICTKFEAVPLSDPSRNRMRPDTRFQIKGRKYQHLDSAAWNLVHRLPGYASTIICSCIALLQMLYRWQHQSRKLWIF
jgi:hypothetical protein